MRSQQQFRIGLLKEMATRMTCSEANCQNYVNGWATVLDVANNEKHTGAARWIEGDSGRRFFKFEAGLQALEHIKGQSEITLTPTLLQLLTNALPGMLVFLFPPGQQCFRPHLDREVVFAHRKGEHVRVHQRAEDYKEHWNEEADKLNTAKKAG